MNRYFVHFLISENCADWYAMVRFISSRDQMTSYLKLCIKILGRQTAYCPKLEYFYYT